MVYSMLFLTLNHRFSPFLDTILTVLDKDKYSQYGSGSRGAEFQYGSTWIQIRNTAVLYYNMTLVTYSSTAKFPLSVL